MMKNLKCPYCEHEFSINIDREINSRKTINLRFMGMSKNIGPKPRYIQMKCKNKSCGRNFQVKV